LEFLLSEFPFLMHEAIMFSHKVSKAKDFSFQPWIMEVCDGSIHKGAASVGGVEDLETVVPKELWFCEVRGHVGVGM
jgi:hypothetical protein